MRTQKASQDAREADLRKREADAERVREAVEAERARLKELLDRADRLIWETEEDADIREREWDEAERERRDLFEVNWKRLSGWFNKMIASLAVAVLTYAYEKHGVSLATVLKVRAGLRRDYGIGGGEGRQGDFNDLIKTYARIRDTDAPKWKDRSEAAIGVDLSTQQRRVDEMRRDAERTRDESEGLGA